MPVLALIFDFDDTMVPDSTTALLEHYGVDSKEFWSQRAAKLVEAGYDPPLAYLNLILRDVAPGRPLDGLTNAKLVEFGRDVVDKTWFPGLPALFEELRELADQSRDVSIEYYIISGGLQAVIEGSPTVQQYVSGVYGCQLAESAETGAVAEVQRCVTFTEKTRFLFEISKGISAAEARTKPHLVNRKIDDAQRPVPFSNMIYVGDGLTDIPCFSLVEKGGGSSFAVFKPGEESAKRSFQELLATGRVRSMHSPDFGSDADLGAILRLAVASKASAMQLGDSLALT